MGGQFTGLKEQLGARKTSSAHGICGGWGLLTWQGLQLPGASLDHVLSRSSSTVEKGPGWFLLHSVPFHSKETRTVTATALAGDGMTSRFQ